MKSPNILLTSIAALTIFAGQSGCFSVAQAAGSSSANNPGEDWPVYGGQLAGDHYSKLSLITPQNVRNLKPAWTYDTGEQGGLQTSPIIVGRVLFGYTPTQKVIAIDAGTGQLLWKFDSGVNGTQPARGLAYWSDGHEGRVLAGVMNFLYALDASTGKPISSFGEGGRIDLRKDLRGDFELQSIALTTPGVVYKDLIIVGGRNPETHPAPPGDIRAFDVRSGALRWTFHTIPHPGEFGYETWPKDAWKDAGAANNWSGMSVDVKRGIVYVPTGSAVFDFYGGDRVGNDLFANTLLALDAETGKRLWHFQGVHHDIWDRDFPAPPALLTVQRNGKPVDAIVQTTKQGYVYLFDRTTGKPLFPVKEVPYPRSEVPGEVTSPTQPRPTAPEPYARQLLTDQMLTNRTPEAHAWALKEFRTYRSAGQFLPFVVDKQTVVLPGFDGGAEWGGPAVDPATNVLYVNANEMAWTGGLTENKPTSNGGASVYQSQCGVCHGENLAGSPPAFPSLVNIGSKNTREQITAIVRQGRGRMPGFPGLTDDQLKSLLDFLAVGKKNPTSEKAEMPSTPAASPAIPSYSFTGYHKFLDPDGYPAIAPPWGTLNAIDLNTGKYLWKIPLGEYPELSAKGMTNTGSENYGGPIVTASGLLFISATVYDKKFRAFDSHTGKLLWETSLPFSGTATPATYMVDGKQYVVIACGGGKVPNAISGGMYVAFALP